MAKKIDKRSKLMELNNAKDYEKLENELATNGNLKENYTIKKGEKLKPKIIIYGMQQDLTNDEIINCIRLQNDIPEETYLKFEFKMNTQNGTNVVICTGPEVFNNS